jgi:hypothetical protein
MLDQDVKIVNQTEDRRVDVDTATFVPIIRVSFKVGTHGPFVQKFDKADFSQVTRDLALNAFAREVRV